MTTMTTESTASPPLLPSATQEGKEVIMELNDNDVIFGRGSAVSVYIGNKRFRDLTEMHKEEYKQASQNKQKKKIAKSILDHVHSVGGRFLRLADGTAEHNTEFSFENGRWLEVDEDAALEKIKQACRENRNKDRDHKRKQRSFLGSNFVPSSPAGAPQGALVMSPVLPPYVFVGGGSGVSPMQVDPRLLLLHQQLQASARMHQMMLQPPAATVAMALGYGTYLNSPPRNLDYGQPRQSDASTSYPDNLPSQVIAVDQGAAKLDAMNAKGIPFAASTDTSTIDPDREEALVGLSALKMANEPKFTEQDLELEQKLMTDEERAEILSDMFGKWCTVENDDAGRPDKRARRDLDGDSIKFLLDYMRGEIVRTPNEQKPALLEALNKYGDRSEEFCDRRLEHFLRVEGMNAKLAAQRFINYWEARREVFGDKYLLPMTLGGAMRDDLAALEAITYYVLPHADVSGRPLLFSVPHTRGDKGLSTQSLLRVFWYAVEVISTQNADVNRGYVQVVWNKDATLFDYDIYGYKRMTYFQQCCWPAKVVATHVCCSPRSSLQIIKPIVFAFMKKGARSRSIMHDVPEHEIIKVLSRYGILKNMLPALIGGGLEMNQASWIASRRAAELQEI